MCLPVGSPVGSSLLLRCLYEPPWWDVIFDMLVYMYCSFWSGTTFSYHHSTNARLLVVVKRTTGLLTAAEENREVLLT